MKKILKRALILVLCAAFFASCGTTEKSATADGAKEEKVAKSDKQAAKEQKKADKQKAKEKKKAGKSKEAKSGDYLIPINEAVAAGEYEDAYTMLSDETNKSYLGSDDVYNMDAGMVKFYADDNTAAISHLGPVANMDKLNDKYAGADKVVLSTFCADEYSQPYETYDYEDIYAIIFDAAAKLDDPATADAAFQDLKNIREMLLSMDQYNKILSSKLDEAGKLDDDTTKNLPQPSNIVYHNSALANYLALIYNKYNDRDGDQKNYFYKQMEESYAQDSYVGQSMPEKAKEELDSVPAGKARLNVLAMMGLMAEKKEHGQDAPTPLGMISSKVAENDQIKNANLDIASILNMLNPFKDTMVRAIYTELQDRTALQGPCVVTINGTDYTLETIENSSEIAKKCIERKQYIAARRSVFRTSLKSIPLFVSYLLLPDPAGIANPLTKKAAEASIGNAGNKIREALKNDHADIRGAHFYPAEVQALGIELDPGTYEVAVKFPGQEPINKTVEVKAGKLNLLEVECLK